MGLGRRPGDSRPLKIFLFPPDSDEEIFVSKKLKSRKVLQDSDSERENANASPEKTSNDNVEEEDKENLYARKNRKVRKVYKTLMDSDESDIEESLYQDNLETQTTPCVGLGLQSENSLEFTVDRKSSKKPIYDREESGRKAKVKSKRRLEKEERKLEKIRRLKKKETKTEVHLKEESAVSFFFFFFFFFSFFLSRAAPAA